jgi:hypothetical protein
MARLDLSAVPHRGREQQHQRVVAMMPQAPKEPRLGWRREAVLATLLASLRDQVAVQSSARIHTNGAASMAGRTMSGGGGAVRAQASKAQTPNLATASAPMACHLVASMYTTAGRGTGGAETGPCARNAHASLTDKRVIPATLQRRPPPACVAGVRPNGPAARQNTEAPVGGGGGGGGCCRRGARRGGASTPVPHCAHRVRASYRPRPPLTHPPPPPPSPWSPCPPRPSPQPAPHRFPGAAVNPTPPPPQPVHPDHSLPAGTHQQQLYTALACPHRPPSSSEFPQHRHEPVEETRHSTVPPTSLFHQLTSADGRTRQHSVRPSTGTHRPPPC